MAQKLPPVNDPDERDRAVGPVDFADSELPVDSDPERAEPALEENPDGSVSVSFDSGDEEPLGPGEFLDNLALTLPPEVLSKLATTMLDNFERDKESRKKRDEQYAEGIKRTGLGNEAPGGATFPGATRAVHPVLIEGCIEFSARSMKELFPPSGPVKAYIVGEQTEEKVSKAERKKTYMNWQLTKQIKEYRSELEQTLTQVPLGGSQYLKVWYDERVERPRCEFVPIDEMLLPFAASDFYSAERRTHVQKLTKDVFEARVKSGLYRDVPVGSALTFPDATESSQAAAKVEGKEEEPFNEDGLRTVYESYCELSLEGDQLSDGDQRGYILTIDESSQQVLALYRNWDEEDTKKCPETLEWIVEFGFIPWRGAYKIGLSHIIGGLSGALTGALRGLLDKAHLDNTPGGVMLKGSKRSGTNANPDPTEYTALEGPPGVDDIRKLAMPFPTSGPSTVLFQLLDWLTAQAKGVVSTASEAIKDAGNDMPVGTALALIEQGSITFSAVHARLHESQARVLGILHRINGVYLDDEVTVEELGSLVVGRKDFQGPMDVVPVSDPNIFSEAQRYAQNQAAIALSEKFPGAIKVPKLVSNALRLMNYPGWEDIVNAPKAAKQLEALEENVQAGQEDSTLKAFVDQDDLQHLQAHLQFMSSPVFCANPLMAMPALPKLLAHCKEHLLAMYKKNAQASIAVSKLLMPGGRSQMQGLAIADKQMSTELADLMPLLEAAQALAAKLAPQPVDPNVQKTQMEIAYKKEKDQADRELNTQLAAAQAQKEAEQVRMGALETQIVQQAESQRAAQEMAVAQHNAQLAAVSEAEERRAALIMAHMKQDAENLRATQADQTKIFIEELKAGRTADQQALQQDFEGYQAHMQRQFDLMQGLLAQPNASASGSADRQLAGGDGSPSVAKAKKRWNVLRDENGNAAGFEEV